LAELDLGNVTVAAIVRAGERHAPPPSGTRIAEDDVLEIHGPRDALLRAEHLILG
jgi:K+/H+ antiporter YhaU regulatory subunit KhtT